MKQIFSKQIWWGIGAALAAGFVVLFLWGRGPVPEAPAAGTDSGRAGSPTRRAVPDDVKVPEAGAEGMAENIAVPETVIPAGTATNAKLREFVVEANGYRFAPDTLIARKDDVIRIKLSARDRAYDFIQPDYGFRVAVAQGTTEVIEFNASAPGVFLFFCGQCEKAGNTMEGRIVVTKE